MTRARRLVVVVLTAVCCVLPASRVPAQGQSDYFISGHERFQAGEYDRAVEDLQKAVAAQPESEVAWFYLGAAQFELVYQSLATRTATESRDYSEAEASLRKALQMAPSRTGTRMYLGRIYEDRHQLDRASDLYREELGLRTLSDRSAVRVALGRVAYKAGNYEDTMTMMRRVLAEEPLYTEASYYVGLTQAARKQYSEAIDTFKGARSVLEKWADEVYRLLRLQYLTTDPDDPQKASMVLEDWDQLRKELWELRRALRRPAKDTLEQITEQYHRAQDFAINRHLWPELNKALGDAYAGMGDWATARNTYRRAMKPREGDGSPDDPDAWARLGRSYFLNGRQLFEDKGLLLQAIGQFTAAEGEGSKEAPITDPEKWDGYGRALYVAGIARDADIDDLLAPPEPDEVMARVFDGLGELYLYQANTYSTDETAGIYSHTHKEAIEAFDKALKFDPAHVPALAHKAQALVDRGERAGSPADMQDDLRAARALLEEEALALRPNDPDLWAQLARAYYGMDDNAKAEAAAKQALRIDRKHVVALNLAGLVKYRQNRCVEAAADFSEAIDAAPNDFQSYVNLGNALYGLRSWGRAQAEYARALELIPRASIANTGSQRPYVMYLIARTQHEQKAYDRAIATLGEVLEQRTDFYEAQRLLAASYSGQAKWRAAEEALQAALKSAPPDDARRQADTRAHLGQVYEVQGRPHEAIAQYRIALSQYPANIEAADGLQRLSWQVTKTATTDG